MASHIRLIDDFLIGFDSEKEARLALNVLRSSLWTYNLQLNETKSSVVPSKFIFEDRWKLELAHREISESALRQKRDISSFLDLTLHLCAETKSAAPASWACKRLSNLGCHSDNFGTLISAFLRLARDFPASISHVCSFIVNRQDECRKNGWVKRISIGLKQLVRTHSSHKNDLEVAWCLLAASALGIKWEKSDFEFGDGVPNSITFSILGLMREKRLLTDSLSVWPWKTAFKRAGILDHLWLPFYESVRRNWTTDKTIIGAVQSDPILKSMLLNKITFLDTEALYAAHIDIGRRVFSRRKSSDYAEKHNNVEATNDVTSIYE